MRQIRFLRILEVRYQRADSADSSWAVAQPQFIRAAYIKLCSNIQGRLHKVKAGLILLNKAAEPVVQEPFKLILRISPSVHHGSAGKKHRFH